MLMLCGHRSSGHRPWSPFLRGDLISFDVVITFLDAATLWLSSFPFWSASIISLGGGPSQEEDTLEFHFEGGSKVTKRLAIHTPPGDFQSNDVTSGSVPVTWGHVKSFPVM